MTVGISLVGLVSERLAKLAVEAAEVVAEVTASPKKEASGMPLVLTAML